MLVFEKFTFFVKFLPTEAIDYGYSKIVLPQLLTKCIYHYFFVCLVFLIDLMTYPY